MNTLRRQMEAEMAMRGLAYRTRETYVESVAKLAKFYGRRLMRSVKPKSSVICCTCSKNASSRTAAAT